MLKSLRKYTEVLSNIGFDVVVTMTDGHEVISANESINNFIKNPFYEAGKVFL